MAAVTKVAVLAEAVPGAHTYREGHEVHQIILR